MHVSEGKRSANDSYSRFCGGMILIDITRLMLGNNKSSFMGGLFRVVLQENVALNNPFSIALGLN